MVFLPYEFSHALVKLVLLKISFHNSREELAPVPQIVALFFHPNSQKDDFEDKKFTELCFDRQKQEKM